MQVSDGNHLFVRQSLGFYHFRSSYSLLAYTDEQFYLRTSPWVQLAHRELSPLSGYDQF